MVTKQAQTKADEAKPGANSVTQQAQDAFKAIIAQFASSEIDRDKAKEALGSENERHSSARVALLVGLADAAVKGDWAHKYAMQGIEAAIAAYEKGRNGVRASSLRQFATECGRAIHPKAREHVKATFDQASLEWEAEGKRLTDARNEAKDAGTKFDKSSVPTPLRDAFKRQYHMVVGSNGLLAARADKDAAKAELAEASEMLADRVMQDERTNPQKAQRAITRAVTTLQDIAAEFPHPRWDTVIAFLEGMDTKALTKARDDMLKAKRNASGLRKRGAAVVDEANEATDELIDE